MAEDLNLENFDFPEISTLDLSFPTLDVDPKLLEEARKKGFYNGNTKYNKLFSDLFFKGGSVTFKSDVSEDFINKAWPYCRAIMGSFTPKHEAKEAVCALIFSKLLKI